MQESFSTDSKWYYEFIYIEVKNKIVAWKAQMDTEGDLVGPVEHCYVLNVYRKKNGAVAVSCDCMGYTYHGHCKHSDFCTDAFDFLYTKKPRSFINQTKEAYVKEWLEHQTKPFDAWAWKE